jgi:hypothetical protein
MPSGDVVFLILRRLAGIVPRPDACRPHHIHHSGRKAKQQKNDQPPRRDSKQSIKRPADGGTDQDPDDEFAGEPKTARVSRCIGGRLTAVRLRRFAQPVVAELIAETPESRGESGLVGSALFLIVTRIIRHFNVTCAVLTIRFPVPSRRAGPYLLGLD